MADQGDARRIALSLPETLEADDTFAFSVLKAGKEKGFHMGLDGTGRAVPGSSLPGERLRCRRRPLRLSPS
jgi:hypothetical protein